MKKGTNPRPFSVVERVSGVSQFWNMCRGIITSFCLLTEFQFLELFGGTVILKRTLEFTSQIRHLKISDYVIQLVENIINFKEFWGISVTERVESGYLSTLV